MRIVALVWVVALGLPLIGCSPMKFAKADAKPGDFERDKYDCEAMLGYRGHAGGNQPTDQLADYMVRGRDEMRACLQRKGWTLQEE